MTRRATCEQCGAAIADVRVRGVGEIVQAVRVNGRVIMPEPLARWLCDICVERRKRGHKWQQLDLFGER